MAVIEYNNGQRTIIHEALQFLKNDSEQLFQISGGPGRGKTFTIKEIVRRSGIPMHQIAPMGYIGAAAMNLRANGFPQARTIHSWLYNPAYIFKVDKEGNVVDNGYFHRPELQMGFTEKPLHNIKLIIVDEAYCVPETTARDIISRGIKVIALGDVDQLPCVVGHPYFLTDRAGAKIHYLTEPMRQKVGSNMLYLADRLLHGQQIHNGFYGDVLVIDQEDLTDKMIGSAEIILCGKNETKEMFNKHIRQNLLNIKTDIPQYGEKMICRKNNKSLEVDGINLANGLLGTIANHPDCSSFDGKNLSIDFLPYLCNYPFIKIPMDYEYLMASPKERPKIKMQKFNTGEKFEFGYALTGHVTQGSTFNFGIVYQEYLSPEINRNLDYTMATRFKHGLIFVRQKRKYW